MDNIKKKKILADCKWFEYPRNYEYPFVNVNVISKTKIGGYLTFSNYQYVWEEYEEGKCFRYLSKYVESIINEYEAKDWVEDFEIKIYNIKII